jgi:AmmeMemoRadiSam system protein B
LNIRPALFRGAWYPRDRGACDDLLDELAGERRIPVSARPDVRGGIVPHAGWHYSGPIAEAVVRSVAAAKPDLVVVFGAHLPSGVEPILTDADAWESPYGAVPISRPALEAVRPLAGGFVWAVETARRSRRDNAVELEIPLVARHLPGVPVLAVGVPPDDRAPALGAAVGSRLAGVADRPVFLGSTDLTHYGPSYDFAPMGTGEKAHAWAKDENDAEFVALAEALDPAGLVRSAAARNNACCPGAAAAAIAAAEAVRPVRPALGRGEVLARTTSHEVDPDRPPIDFVGYCGIVF